MPSNEFFNDVDIKGNVLYNAVAHQAASNPVGKADGFWYYNTTTRRFMFQQDGVFSDFGMPNPMTTSGDMIVGGADGAPGRLGIGTEGQILTMVNGVPAWANAPDFPEPTPTPSVTPTPTPSASPPPPSSWWPPLPPATFDSNFAFYVSPAGSVYLDPDYEGYWYPADAVTDEEYRVYRNTTKWARASYSDYHVVSLHATHEDAIADTNAVYVVTDEWGSEVDFQYSTGWIFPAVDGWDQYNVNLCGTTTPPA